MSEVERSLAFYEAALEPLGIRFFMPYMGEGGHPDLWGFGDGKRAVFWLKQGKADPASIHWGFRAASDGEVDAFYRAAMAAGARDNISPRARFRHVPAWNITRDTMRRMCWILTGIPLRLCIRADG